MITIEKFKDGTTLVLCSATARFSGYGHYTVEIELSYRDVSRTFKKTTTDTEAIDDAKDLGADSWEDKTLALYNAVSYELEDNIYDWMQDVDYDIEHPEEEEEEE